MCYYMAPASIFVLATLVVTTMLTIGCGSERTQAPQAVQLAAQAAPVHSKFATEAPSAVSRENAVMTKACSADKINDSEPAELVKIDKATPLKISGWAVDDLAGSVPGEIYVELVPASGAARYYARAARLTKRPDVAKAHNNPVFEDSGYDLDGDLEAVPAGAYSVFVAEPVAAGVILCDTRRKIEIK